MGPRARRARRALEVTRVARRGRLLRVLREVGAVGSERPATREGARAFRESLEELGDFKRRTDERLDGREGQVAAYASEDAARVRRAMDQAA